MFDTPLDDLLDYHKINRGSLTCMLKTIDTAKSPLKEKSNNDVWLIASQPG